MRVLVHAVAGGYGGAERTMECLVPYLADRCELVFYVENGLHIAKLEGLSAKHRLEVVQAPGGRSITALLRAIGSTFRLCRERDFDVVVTNTNKSALVMGLVRQILPSRLGLVVFIRDFQWTYARLVFRLLGNRPVFAGPSEAIADYWPASYGQRKSSDAEGTQRLAILPSPFKPRRGLLEILPDCFEPVEGKGTLPRSDRWLLVLGTVNRWKGIDVAIEALARLGEGFEDVGLRIVGREGDPGLVAELMALAERRGVAGQVVFVPHVDEVDAVIASSHCVISASVPWNGGPETFGRTVVEAWAWKRPVIASDCGGPLHLIEHEVDGLLFEAGSAADLAVAIRRVVADPELADRLGENGFMKYSCSYTSKAVAKGFEELLVQAVAKAKD